MDKIKYLIIDVDGTLTDGKIYMGSEGEIFKAFNIKDGYAIRHILPSYKIIPIIITGRESQIVENRCKELEISEIYQNIKDKIDTLDKILNLKGGQMNEVAYIGDDINDLPCMKRIIEVGGIVGCPADAIDKVKDIATFISKRDGGDGAVREFIDWLILL